MLLYNSIKYDRDFILFCNVTITDERLCLSDSIFCLNSSFYCLYLISVTDCDYEVIEFACLN